MVVFGQSCCIRAKVVVLGQKGLFSDESCSIRAKVVVLGQSGCVRANVIVFGQKLLYSGKVVLFWEIYYNRAKWLY